MFQCARKMKWQKCTYDGNLHIESNKSIKILNIYIFYISALTNKCTGFVLKLSFVLHNTNLHNIIIDG